MYGIGGNAELLKRETRLIASVHDLYQFYVRLRFIHVGAIHELPLQRSFG